MNIYFSALSMKSDPYPINNPLETTNSFTKTNVDDAVDVLELANKLSVGELKSALKEYDFTSVSTHELAMAGSLLYESGLIEGDVASFFTSGRMAHDETGRPTETDVKFNAIALFNQMLEDRYASGFKGIEGFTEITKSLTRANHILGALSYFAKSAQSELSVSVYA